MKKLLVIVGPTGTGKTDLALELGKKFDGELVSADSRQIYIGMDVGTGKMPVQVQNSKFKVQKFKKYWIVNDIPIHLYDLITPDKTFSVAAYQQAAYKAIEDIHQRDNLPILVGGTGLYVRAVVEGLKIPKAPPDKNLRDHLEAQPLPILVRQLEKVDPAAATKIDKQNPRRIIRALEVYHQTGKPMSQLSGDFKKTFDCLKIGLTAPRATLYARVDQRIDSWMQSGFIDEVKDLLKKEYKEDAALTSLGYRQITMYLENKLTLKETIQRIKFDHHGYIRSQLTWFRKEPGIFWFDIEAANFKKEAFGTVKEWLS